MAGHRINGPSATRAERQHRKRLKQHQKDARREAKRALKTLSPGAASDATVPVTAKDES